MAVTDSLLILRILLNRSLAQGKFEWQFPNKDKEKAWKHYSFSEERWWGTFPKDLKAPADMYKEYPWALGPFTKYEGNPVLAPTPGAWDQGRHDGGTRRFKK